VFKLNRQTKLHFANLFQLTVQQGGEQQKRLIGIGIKGPYEPGDSVVDRFVSSMRVTGSDGSAGTNASAGNMSLHPTTRRTKGWLSNPQES
jgi:hypothetical protein